MQRKVLGKGLEALIPKKQAVMSSASGLVYLSLAQVKISRYQPRQDMDPIELSELANSIKEKGFIQPIVVRKIDHSSYEIVAGGRRFEAAKSLGLNEIPAIIKELNDEETLTMAIIENLQRKNLNPIEEAEAFLRLIDEFEFTQDMIAKFVSKDKTTVANTLRLLKLPQAIQQALRKGVISRSQGRTILGIEKTADQDKLFRQILSEGLSVREIEKRVSKVSNNKKTVDPFVAEVEETLQTKLGTKVRVFNKRNNKGKIVIEYYTLEDLDRVLRRLG